MLDVKTLYMRDRVVKKLFTSSSDGYKYLSKIISEVINIPVEVIEVEMKFTHPEVSINEHITNNEVDIIADIDNLTVNIEVNAVHNKRTENKNMKYICHIKLKNINENYLTKKIIQINLNAYDIIKKGKFITKTEMYNHDIQGPLHNFAEIYDVNLEYLTHIPYNDVRKEEKNSLIRLLYLLVNSKEEELRMVYEGDKFMNKMVDHAKEITQNFDEMLYYDPDEFLNQVLEDEREEYTNRKIAKKLIEEKVADDIIARTMNLSLEEVEELKKTIEK